MLGNKRYCYPLTVTDYCTRFLIGCEGLPSTRSALTYTVFERLFRDCGVPLTIRTDNGKPFAPCLDVQSYPALGLVAPTGK